MTCAGCGLSYRDFRTGLTFYDVKQMMYTGSDDPKDWRYKRRRSVLGFWRQLKLMFWAQHVGECECSARDQLAS